MSSHGISWCYYPWNTFTCMASTVTSANKVQSASVALISPKLQVSVSSRLQGIYAWTSKSFKWCVSNQIYLSDKLPPHNFCKFLRITTSGFSWIVLILHLTSVKTWAVLVSMEWKNRYCQEDFSVEVMEKVGFPSDGTSRSHMAYTLPGRFPSGFHTLNHLILTTICV